MTLFDLDNELPRGRIVIEASAGTGKTFALSALVARHLIERDDLEPKHVLMMTFTNASAADLKSRTREMLIIARAALESGSVPAGYEWMSTRWLDSRDSGLLEERLLRARRAINRFDEMTISTIHGFCQQALRQLGLRSGAPIELEVVGSAPDRIESACRDFLLERAIASDLPKLAGETFSDLIGRVLGVVQVKSNNPHCRIVPSQLSEKEDPSGTVGEDHFCVKDESKRTSVEEALVLIEQCLERVRVVEASEDVVSYDTLIRLMVDVIVLAEEFGEHHALALLRDRFRLGMVDEFQDTDRQQWRIVNGLFPAGDGRDLVLVGDPKQAIYRFRGADVNTYLDAKATIISDSDQTRVFELGTNYRSDPRLIDATNALLAGFRLGDERIEVSSVGADPKKSRLLGLGSSKPLRVRLLDDSVSNELGLPGKRASILRDMVRQIGDLIGADGTSPETITEKGDTGPVTRPVRPGDIAVLVPSNRLGEKVHAVLAEASIPAVRLGTGSVFDVDWLLDQVTCLFEALDRPAYLPFVRSAALSVFFGRNPADVDPSSQRAAEMLEEIQTQCHLWSRELAKKPFMEWWVGVRDRSQVVTRLMNTLDGERKMTDLDHLMEVIGEWGGTRPIDASSVVQFIVEQQESGDSDSDTFRRRIEGDSQAVTISTIHRSKGLEFPIVLVPFSWFKQSKGGSRRKSPVRQPKTFDHPFDHGPLVDGGDQAKTKWRVAWWNELETPSGHVPEKAQGYAADLPDRLTARGESFRMLYVALTRAKHHTIVWWARDKDPNPRRWGPLTALLADREPTGQPKQTLWPVNAKGQRNWNHENLKIEVPDEAREIVNGLTPVVDISKGGDSEPNLSVEIVDLNDDDPREESVEVVVAHPSLREASVGDRAIEDETWRRWSFSGIKRDRELDDNDAVDSQGFETNDDGDEKKGVEDIDREMVPAPGSVLARESEPFGCHGGKLFGVFAHEVFEAFDSSQADLESELTRALSIASGSTSYAHGDDLVRDFVAVARTPLGPAFGDLSLSQIHPNDRLVEMRFDFPIGDHADDRRLVAAVGEVLSRYTDQVPESAREIFMAYCESLRNSERRLAGYMHGAIDAIFRVHGTTGARYVVTDYKTNRLHSSGDPNWRDEYHPEHLWTSMVESDYLMQALIYSVATHRFLQARLGPDYDVDSHFGGISYLYLRGMIGAETEMAGDERYGVFMWRPDSNLIVELDAALAAPMPDAEGAS